MVALLVVLGMALSFCAPATHRPPSASSQCQTWADAPWVAEEGVKEHTLRSWGCRFDGYDGGYEVWSRDRSGCGVQAFRLARKGVTGDDLIAAMVDRGRCVRGDDGGWIRKGRGR